MEEASRLCDRLIIMDRGKLLVEGKPAELVRRHVGRHVLEVAEPAEGLTDFLREQRSAARELRPSPHRLRARTGATSTGRSAIGYCRGGCTMRMATLEDVFLRLTGRELRE